MANAIDLVGKRFGKLLVIERVSSHSPHAVWKCKCDCGEERNIIGQNLRRLMQVSCGCWNQERKTTHGATKDGTVTKEYMSWKAMIQRCTNPNRKHYEEYGGRGITVCDRWLNSFENFLEDMGKKTSARHSIDREDTNGNYEPDNCKWSTQSEQISNQRIRQDNTSGHKGVSWDKNRGKWHAYLNRNKSSRLNIGYYVDLQDAITARENAEADHLNKQSS